MLQIIWKNILLSYPIKLNNYNKPKVNKSLIETIKSLVEVFKR